MSISIIDTLKPLGNFPIANASDVQAGDKKLNVVLNEKADVSSVNASMALKSDKSYVDAELLKKADKTDLNSKADNTTVNIVSERVSSVESEQNVLSARMDTFTELTEGSTTGDAELADARIAADGTEYSNAGNAIRGQVSELKKDISKINDIVGCTQYVVPNSIINSTYWESAGVIGALSDWQSIGKITGLKAGKYYFCGANPSFSWVVNKSTNESVSLGTLYEWDDSNYYKKHSATINYDFDLYLSRQSNYSEVTKFSSVDFENTFSYESTISESVDELKKAQETDIKVYPLILTDNNILTYLPDFNDADDNTLYRMAVNNIAAHMPSDLTADSYYLLTITNEHEEADQKKQIIFKASGGTEAKWVRYYQFSGWWPWERVETIDDVDAKISKIDGQLSYNSYINSTSTLTNGKYWSEAGESVNLEGWQIFEPITNLKSGKYYFCGINPNFTWIVKRSDNTSVKIGSLFTYTDTDYFLKHSVNINYDFDLYVSRQTSFNAVTKFSASDFEDVYSYSSISDSLAKVEKELSLVENKIGGIDTGDTTIIYVGSGETYKNINSALNAINDNSVNKKYKIIVKSGTYNVPSSDKYFGIKNYVDIEGEDKATVIVKNIYSTSSYDAERATFDPARYTDSIVSAKLSNMTIISQGCKCPIHIDGNNIANGGNITIDNCILMDLNTPNNYDFGQRLTRIGGLNCGLGNGQSVTVKNTISNGTLYAHNWENTSAPSTFTIDNCSCRGTLIGCAYEVNVKDNYIIKNSTLDYVGIQTLYATSNKYNIVMSNNNINYIFAPDDDNITNPYSTFDLFFAGKCGIPDTSCMKLMFNCSDTAITRGNIVYCKSDDNNRGWLSDEYIKGTGSNFAGIAMENIPAYSVGWVQFRGKISISTINSANYGDLIDFVNGNFILHQNGNVPIASYAEPSPLYADHHMIKIIDNH